MGFAWAQSASATAPRIRTWTLHRPAFARSNVSDLKQLAREIFHETLAAIDIPLAMRQKLPPPRARIHFEGEAIYLARYARLAAMALAQPPTTIPPSFPHTPPYFSST